MFNQIFKNINTSIESSFPIISNMQQNTNVKTATSDNQIDVEKLIEVILKLLSNALSERLGEVVDEGEFKDIAADLLRSKTLESHLVQTKQRYNDLVNKSTNLYQQARKISSSIGEFISSINLFLQSEQLLVPLKQIQKGINDLQSDKVEKQMNYLIRIFENNFEEVIQKKIQRAQSTLHEEIKLLKNLNRNLEGEIVNIKNNKNQEESKFYQLTLKINTLNERVAKLNVEKGELEKNLKNEGVNASEKLKFIADQQRQVYHLKSREVELSQKIRVLETRANRNERNLKEQNNESEGLNIVIEKLKLKQEEIIEELEKESKKKEAISEILRKKLQNEKIYLQEKLDLLSEKYTALEAILLQKEEELHKMAVEVNLNKAKGDIQIDLQQPSSKEEIKQTNEETNEKQPNPDVKHKISLNELMNRMSNLQARNKELEAKLSKQLQCNVNKEVFKSLFINYDDESKEWAVRRNIKYQIYALIGLNEKIPKAEDNKATKWFGLF